MIRTMEEFYYHGNDIIDKLEESGYSSQAQSLKQALSISTIPSEVLGETRNTLRELKKNPVTKELSLKKEIKLMLKFIRKVW